MPFGTSRRWRSPPLYWKLRAVIVMWSAMRVMAKMPVWSSCEFVEASS